MAQDLESAPGAGLLEELLPVLLESGLSARFVATGDSMEPTISHGDAVLVRPWSGPSLRPGVVALYRGSRGLIAHRIVRVDRDSAGQAEWIHLRGDAVPAEDAPIRTDAVLGEVVAVRHHDHERGVAPARPGWLLAAAHRVRKRIDRWHRRWAGWSLMRAGHRPGS